MSGNVTIMQLSWKFEQGFTIEEDAQALVEVILLSFSDEMIVTPMSTFGGVAHAYGALVPWFARKIKWFHEKPEDEDEPTSVPYVRRQTVDACQHLPPKAFECPHDPDFHGTSVVALAPYFRDCLAEDTASDM
jgi:xyloglucan fucosyltransferase